MSEQNFTVVAAPDGATLVLKPKVGPQVQHNLEA